MEYKTALKRLNTLKGHVSPSVDAKRELDNATFDLSHAQEKFWSTYPESYFQTFECFSELHGVDTPSLYNGDKETNRKDAIDILIRLTYKMFEKGYTSPEKIADNIDAFLSGIMALHWAEANVWTRYAFHYGLYCKTIANLGTERHRDILLEACALKTLGCYGLTELGHGSNVRGMEITAEYDRDTKEFVMNSPTKTAIKFWIGGLAKSAQNAVINAQLIITENGKKINKGVHAFVFQIRDRMNHIPLPGLEIGDCGHKNGANGIDNGWIKFDHFRVPREALLNKFGDVSEDGVYLTDIEDNNKRFANSMACLSGGRVIITRNTSENGLIASTIAIRYAGVRRQFGPGKEETLLLDYPLHQYRLFTRFAENFMNLLGANRLNKIWLGNLTRLLEPKNATTELCHALSSSLKAFASWTSQETAAECRRACGGNGYSHYALFGLLMAGNDLHATWEGDNHVLLLQLQKFLLRFLNKTSKGKETPETLEFFKLGQMDKPEFSGSFESTKDLSKLFAQRACYLAIKAGMNLTKQEVGIEEGFNDLQPFEMRDMCEAYHDIYCIETFNQFFSTLTDESTKKVFDNLLLLHFYAKMINNSGFFISVFGDKNLETVKTNTTKLLKSLRKEMVKLTHVLPLANKLLGPLGNEDMQVYDRFIQHFKSDVGVTQRPTWWKISYSKSNP